LFHPWRAFETATGHPAHDGQFLSPELMVRGVVTARGWQARTNWSKGVIDLQQTRKAAEALRQAPVGALRLLACHHPLVEMIGTPMTGDVKRGDEAALIFADLDAAASWELVIDSEPSLATVVAGDELDGALAAIGEFAELKSPWLMGHSRGVADLAGEAARGLGLPESDVTALRRAAFVYDIGRLGVSNAVWDKPGELTQSELERVRLHPYLTERMLSFSAALAPLGSIAGQHHERLDGSGYPRGLSGDAISHAGRVLAAADVYHAMTAARPHRPALTAAEAAVALRAQVASSRLDGAAVDAVLRAAGHRVRRRREWPAGLTPREVEIVRLLARGLTARAIADRLGISPKTAGSHIEHIYLKTGASNRAQLSLFAMKYGLMSEQGQ
jgi:HD-GYP domain-containing protein (c-di-GMP phosphodiesterase class II)